MQSQQDIYHHVNQIPFLDGLYLTIWRTLKWFKYSELNEEELATDPPISARQLCVFDQYDKNPLVH